MQACQWSSSQYSAMEVVGAAGLWKIPLTSVTLSPWNTEVVIGSFFPTVIQGPVTLLQPGVAICIPAIIPPGRIAYGPTLIRIKDLFLFVPEKIFQALCTSMTTSHCFKWGMPKKQTYKKHHKINENKWGVPANSTINTIVSFINLLLKLITHCKLRMHLSLKQFRAFDPKR